MKMTYLIYFVVILFSGCASQVDRTDAEMFKLADDIFQNYLFEYRIDNKLFAPPIIERRQYGIISYKWLVLGSENNPIGVEVHVAKENSIEPEWALIGNVIENEQAWRKLYNTKPLQKDIFANKTWGWLLLKIHNLWNFLADLFK